MAVKPPGKPNRRVQTSRKKSGRVLVAVAAGSATNVVKGKRPGNPFVPTAFGFTDPLRGGEQPRRLCRGVSGDRRVCG
jgi:hypothetical protein